MPQSLDDLHLVSRETQRETMRRAQQELMLAAFGGKVAGVGNAARARGLIVRERENSIFSDAWLPLALLFIVIGLLAGRNAGLIALGLVLLLIVGVSTLWKNLSLLGVSYERSFDRTRVFPGEPVVMTVTIQNDKLQPLTRMNLSANCRKAIKHTWGIPDWDYRVGRNSVWPLPGRFWPMRRFSNSWTPAAALKFQPSGPCVSGMGKGQRARPSSRIRPPSGPGTSRCASTKAAAKARNSLVA